MLPTKECKVCNALVRRRKDHQPNVCEACQKFFRRYCLKIRQLGRPQHESCSLNCVINVAKRRFCPRCRFDKCLMAGMRSKYLSDAIDRNVLIPNYQREQPKPVEHPTSGATSSDDDCTPVDLTASSTSNESSSNNDAPADPKPLDTSRLLCAMLLAAANPNSASMDASMLDLLRNCLTQANQTE